MGRGIMGWPPGRGALDQSPPRLTHGRGCTPAARPLETGPMTVDFKPRGFADRTNLKAKDIAAIGVEPRCRIVASGD